MRGSVVLVGALLGAVSLVGVAAEARSAPDPYSGTIDTSCSISVPAVIEPGKRVTVRVGVSANNPTQPTGRLDLTISTSPGGDTVWTKTVPYNGGTKKIVGPKLPKADYMASARFRPSDTTFARCRDSEQFAVDSINDNNPPDDPGPGGLLPDTGGPALLWLLVGVGLVGGGTASIAYSRRRNAPATA